MEGLWAGHERDNGAAGQRGARRNGRRDGTITRTYDGLNRVTELDETTLAAMQVADDEAAGFIYVLRSLSEHPDIKAVPNLHKIGLARRSIEGRIQNAANEPTYLMAPVALVSTFHCYNVNLPKLENLLHRFFDHATAKVPVTDAQGNLAHPEGMVQRSD